MKDKHGLQLHHTSYHPVRTRWVTKEQHVKIHGHGTGPVRGYRTHRSLRFGMVTGVLGTFIVMSHNELFPLVSRLIRFLLHTLGY